MRCIFFLLIFLVACSSEPFSPQPVDPNQPCPVPPNRIPENASLLELNEVYEAPTGDLWYTFRALNAGSYVLTLDTMPPFAALRVIIFDASYGIVAALSEDESRFSESLEFDSDASFLVNVTLQPLEPTCTPYTLSLRRTP